MQRLGSDFEDFNEKNLFSDLLKAAHEQPQWL